eukprot:jgi/Hompol1/2603/HPOL_002976-RA
MPPKKKGSAKKKDTKAVLENVDTVELGLEDKLLKANLEIESLQHELDMSRQYKTMQSEMIAKINVLEKQLVDFKTKLTQIQSAYGEAKRLHENTITEKDALIEEQNMKMTYMTNEFENMLNETLGRMSKKLELASQRWKDNDQVSLSETNAKRLEDFQLTRIALNSAH